MSADTLRVSRISTRTVDRVPENRPGTGAFVKRDDLEHPHTRPREIETLDLPAGSPAMRTAACAPAPASMGLGAAGVRLDASGRIKEGNPSADKARVTRSLGMGITDAMNGYACKSLWARHNIMRSYKEAMAGEDE